MAGDIHSRNTVLQISTRFTENTLMSILRKASGTENVQLVHCEVARGSIRAGDSYLSTLSRLKVDGMADNKPYSLALIVKGLPASIGCRKTFRSAEFFQNEAAFYNEVLPRFMAFQNQKKPKNPFQEIPCCRHITDIAHQCEGHFIYHHDQCN